MSFSLFITATIGSAASHIQGVTTDSAAGLMKDSQLSEAEKEKFLYCYMFLIDEISYFDRRKIEKLDKHLKVLMQNPTKPYGGLNIVFIGDFHQIECFSRNPIYKTEFVQWHSTINCAIFLENKHRFKDDPEYGMMLEQFRTGCIEDSTFDKINTRLVGSNGITIPKNCDELAYACATNKERNSISANVFSNHIAKTHPKINENIDVPMHTLVIESRIVDSATKIKCSRELHKFIYENCGDNDMKYQARKTDPVLYFYKDVPLMINSNKHLKESRGNGTLCRGMSVCFKTNCGPICKIWDGRKVHCASVDDVDHITCEHWRKDRLNEPQKTFVVNVEECTVHPSIPAHGDVPMSFGAVKISQFGVNSNIATTGHKLQGMTKTKLAVSSWWYSCRNWVYVVLSRVTIMNGLYLLKSLDRNQDYSVDKKLLEEEDRLRKIEKKILKKHNCICTFSKND